MPNWFNYFAIGATGAWFVVSAFQVGRGLWRNSVLLQMQRDGVPTKDFLRQAREWGYSDDDEDA